MVVPTYRFFFFPFLWYISINKAKVIPIRFLVSLSNNAYFKHVSFVYGYHTHRGKERERNTVAQHTHNTIHTTV